MALNGSGTFSRLYNWVTDRNNSIKIRADRMDAELDGIATALSQALYKDGQQTVTADIPFGGFRLTGVGTATAGTDALNRDAGDARYIQSLNGVSPITVDDANNNSVVEILELLHTTSGTPGAGIGSRLSFSAETAADNNEKGATIEAIATDVTDTAEVFNLLFRIMTAGSLADAYRMLPAEFRPAANDGASLGSASFNWSDLFAALGAVINFNNGDVTITHSANQLDFAGADNGYHFAQSLFIAEAAAAIADRAGHGQLHVRNNTPNDLYFVDDTGQEVQLTDNGSLAVPTVSGRLLSQQEFSSSGTWTKPVGCNLIRIRLVGGGGAGGGAAESAGDPAGSGGGSGGPEEMLLDVSAISSVTVTIGAGGTPAAGTNGGDGGTTSFGAHCQGTGGEGGKGGTDIHPNEGGEGGVGSGGDVNGQGAQGHSAFSDWAGAGGDSIFSGGGFGREDDGNGNAGLRGSGGGGGRDNTGGSNSGGAGGAGFVIIEEYS